MVTYMRTGRNWSAPGAFWFEAIEAFRSKLLMTFAAPKDTHKLITRSIVHIYLLELFLS